VGHEIEVPVYDPDSPATAFVLRWVAGGVGLTTARSSSASDERFGER
jgi:hypothetical protein